MGDRWWRDAVVYQVYVRSFQDSDGDGIGDLGGVLARLDHIERLGADALWLSPFYPSPLADLGYDVSDHTAVDPRLGSLADLDRLVAEAHARGLRVLLDLVPSHTSIEHPWFRDHPDRYVWSDDGPANNWRASFGGPAWSRDQAGGRWYLHSFYPEQPDLDWRNPEVAEAFAGVVRFWLDRGVDGFRVDAVDRLVKDAELRDDPPAREPYPLALHPEHARLEHRHSRDQHDVGMALRALREAAGGAFLVGEAYVPTSHLDRYLDHLDLAFCFELLHAAWSSRRLADVISRATDHGGVAWTLSNHDFPRLATRLGSENARLAAMLLLTLPGPAFVYQGDEIGMTDGPGATPPVDRFGRDAHRHPMQWSDAANGGFTEGEPWLAPIDPETRNVELQTRDSGSLLGLHRRLIELRRSLGTGFELIGGDDDVLAYRRGSHVVALNLGDDARPLPVRGAVEVATDGAAEDAGSTLAPRAGLIIAPDRI